MENIRIIKGTKKPYLWLPSYYIPSGIPYAAVIIVSAIMYKNLGFSNIEIAFYTSWLYLPWTLKPLWSPIIQIFGNNKIWIVTMQFLIAILFGLLSFFITGNDNIFSYTLAILWIMAFASATHDISGDGLYIESLTKQQQACYVGWISTFYRIAMIIGQGGLVTLAGYLFNFYSIRNSYAITFFIVAIFFILIGIYNIFMLPLLNKKRDNSIQNNSFLKEFGMIFKSYFRRKHIIVYILFLLLFRLAESQLVKISSLFMLDAPESGGLGMSTSDLGIIYGTFGILALTIGGILGGFFIYKFGLKKLIWICVCAINIPDIVYVIMSFTQTQSTCLISSLVIIEMFGYGFGFSAFMTYMFKIAEGKYKTAFMSINTAFMAIGMMVPGMFSGYLQEFFTYKYFFIWIMFCTIPSFIITAFIPIGKDEFKKIKQTQALE